MGFHGMSCRFEVQETCESARMERLAWRQGLGFKI